MIRAVIGTGGHIDHGKTALVEALTGVRTDRLPEEQRRGITIDLGFTRLDLDSGVAGLVDVPGHEDFIRNMVAGASGFDLLLLVVAADEGVMPQTREHVAIAELLGVPRAVVALTKVDLVDEEWLELAADDVATFLAHTPFATAAVVPTSAVTRAGIHALRDAIRDALPASRGRTEDLFRLPVDRVFTVRGTGTVATGTVWSGRLGADDHVRILPGGRAARVRALQVHGEDVEHVEPGQRAAIALAGIERGEAGRGSTLVTDRAWAATLAVTASLRVLAGSRWSIEHGQRIRVHLGTSEIMARAFLLEGRIIEPGAEAWAQIRFEAPAVARTGDRIVVRSYSPVTTIGGGIVAEPAPRRRRRLRPEDATYLSSLVSGDPFARVAAAIHHAGVRGMTLRVLPLITGATPGDVDHALQRMAAVTAGDRAFPADAVQRTASAMVDALTTYHSEHPLRRGMDPEELRRAAPRYADDALVGHTLTTLMQQGSLTMVGGRAALTGFTPSLTHEQRGDRDRILEAFAEAGYAPPRLDELAERLGRPADLAELIALIEADGHLIRLAHDLYMHRDHLQRIVGQVRERFSGRTDVSPAEFRDVVPTSRRHLIPILEHLDRTGVTIRAGEGRALAPTSGAS